jgi:group I intron endonuclease
MSDSTKQIGVYRIINKVNGKIYIGSAAGIGGFNKRWGEHITTLNKNKHGNQHLQKGWNKYGEESFIFEIIEIVDDKNKVIEKEQYYLDLLTPYDELGYNICRIAGNTSGVKCSDETRTKISETKIKKGLCVGDKNPMFGTCAYNKWVEKFGIEIANIKKNEANKKNSEKNSGENNPMFGVSRPMVSELNKKLKGKRVTQYHLNGEFNKEYSSINEAAKENDLHPGKIVRNCLAITKYIDNYFYKFK